MYAKLITGWKHVPERKCRQIKTEQSRANTDTTLRRCDNISWIMQLQLMKVAMYSFISVAAFRM
jgi:hypothetical protein